MKNNLRIIMAKENINMSDLSKSTGLSRSTISAIYHEKSKRVDFETISTLCHYFDCEVNDLFTVKEKTEFLLTEK